MTAAERLATIAVTSAGLAALAMISLSACNAPEPTGREVSFDDWWNRDFARATCADHLREPQCIQDPLGDLASFESEMDTAFSSNPACHGISVTHFYGQTRTDRHNTGNDMAGDRHHWSIMLDWAPGKDRQTWTLMNLDQQPHRLDGTGPPREIVQTICAALNRSGARVAD